MFSCCRFSIDFSVIIIQQLTMAPHNFLSSIFFLIILLHSVSSIGSTINSQAPNQSSYNFTSSLNAIFFKIPSSAEISQLIIDADVVSLLKVVQILGQQTSLKCYDVLSYFLEINGKIYSALAEKEVEIARLETLFEIVQKTIEESKAEIQRSNGWQRVLQLSNNKMELTEKLDNLTRLYNIYNQADLAIQPEQAKIIGYQQEIVNIEATNDGQRKNLLEQELRLAKIDSTISELEEKLKQQQKNKDKSRERITGLKRTINDNEIKIATIKNIINNSKRTIEGLTKKASTVRSSYSQAEIEARKLRDQIDELQKKENELSQYIRNLEEKVRKEEAKLQYYKLQDLRFSTKQLNILLPNVEDAIEKQYTKCYNTNGDFMKIVKINGKVLYVFTPPNFIIYMNKLYGNLTEPSVHALVLLSKVDTKASEWIKTYGNPTYSLQYLGLKYPGVNKELVCIDMDSVTYGSGRILRISNYEVEIQAQNRRTLFLIVTQCSVIESSTMVPKIGQQIYWKGVNMKNLNNYVQLYWATSF